MKSIARLVRLRAPRRSGGAGLVGILVVLASLASCTVVRYRDPPAVVVPPTYQVDGLVLMNLDPSASALAQPAEELVRSLGQALAEKGVFVRRFALAPLHHRIGSVVPLVYGQTGVEPDEMGDPVPVVDPGTPLLPPELAVGSLAAAIRYYTSGPGAPLIPDRASDEGANLLALGAELGTAPLYDPSMTTPEAAFYNTPADGFIVVVINGLAPSCAGGDCGASAAAFAADLGAAGADGAAAWLNPPGDAGIASGHVAYVFVSTAEGVATHQAFSDRCRALEDFPVTLLDSLEPSPAPYYSQVAGQLAARGLMAHRLDLCDVFSARRAPILLATADAVRGTLMR